MSTRRARGPAELGAAPASRASVRNVLLVATTRSGAPGVEQALRRFGRAARSTCSRSAAISRLRRRVVAEPLRGSAGPRRAGPRTRRPGPRRCRPRVRANRRRCRGRSRCPALQPNQRRTARNVSRASSSPDSTLARRRPRSRPARARGRCCRASRTADVAKASISSQPSSSASLRRGDRGRDQRVGAVAAEVAVAVDVLGEPQLATCASAAAAAAHRGGRRPRADAPCSTRRPARRVASASNLSALRLVRSSACRNARSSLDFPREWIEFADPADP